MPETANSARLSRNEAGELCCLSLIKTSINFPNPCNTIAELEEATPRNVEYDARLYYPPAVYSSRRAVLQAVGKRVDISIEDAWGGRAPCTRIVAIGAPGALQGDALRGLFDECLARVAVNASRLGSDARKGSSWLTG